MIGRNQIPAGSGSFIDPLSGIRKDLGSSRASFSEFVSNSTIWGAGDSKWPIWSILGKG